jgi:hypothetical protein
MGPYAGVIISPYLIVDSIVQLSIPTTTKVPQLFKNGTTNRKRESA